jgi:pyruvate/oxaloacetate carboxyltransferase
MIPNGTKNLVKGLYGKSAAPIDEEIKNMAIGDEDVITSRPADLMEPELEKLKKELGSENIEDVLSYALFPQVAKRYFLERDGKAIDDYEVAAIVVALAAKFLKIKTQTGPQRIEGKTPLSPWGIAGRMELMNARGRNP